MKYDRIILGAGLYGLYAARRCGSRGESVLVLECEEAPFMRATYINQARVHMGYHYPRSLSTSMKSAGYFKRFSEDFGFCIHSQFDQIYGTSSSFSWTNAAQFKKFCDNAGIPCEELPPSKYFKDGMCDGAFVTTEYTYDCALLKDYMLSEIAKFPSVRILCGAKISHMEFRANSFDITLEDGTEFTADFLLNATYASVNGILSSLGLELFKIKYELCEIILCDVNDLLKSTGITVMDGPFFSIMPFGKSGHHSLTSVTFTPHVTCKNDLPSFECQQRSEGRCSPAHLCNCNLCPYRPKTAWSYMSSLAGKYLRDEYHFEYAGSLFSMKPILKASEIDDSRPTVIKEAAENPSFYSVLSGKINTVYDLDEVLDK
ncbi:MAG: FAD-dependent oxidoreductase [Clostridia bacterium]|nr:FAD-dependent oxidoreductase [Clostridia bacterium]